MFLILWPLLLKTCQNGCLMSIVIEIPDAGIRAINQFVSKVNKMLVFPPKLTA